ncbi:hypothetical protein MsAm2_13900 [Methanolapillus ohkumae]|uniref:Uncharacterized protein n=1 Tax=Methanolapillus ohkumae TaxID=3028298 RepID=A0AA96V968_9EURY|nr:hypothetical protein MsAm2_13900 [Methanosarcinaceae archaeon Am2]
MFTIEILFLVFQNYQNKKERGNAFGYAIQKNISRFL